MSESSQDAIDKINQLASQPASPAPFQKGLAQGTDAMANGSQAMLTQAHNGALAIDPQAGQSLINAVNAQIETLHGLSRDIARITRETKLGMTVGGQTMSKFNQQVATSGDKAFEPAHQQLIETLATVAQAVQVAMDNYANTDNDNASQLKAKD
ncbi:MAG TPA: hypothetical protein VJ914_29985 [Pseudonocardiaceae bacterium]|nr:hypothetical protein [Pseudonocardiaceae bacterium]